ncbi:hypothetical protein JL100_015870 [Skermanella mucosa]|uniref:hypothetical protein n=1 Tax=Skermanella mucosa TaxID=1789672 RepID=UPI00192AD302|nr:hypothetical protein [Skermanella mucosa]UEM18595.1 hypothetical protein JL100_015870 [Skermanella mucosa]
MKAATCFAAAAIALGSFTPVAAQSTGNAPDQSPNMSGELPKDSLAKERRGALGENPESVTQKGARGDQPTGEVSTTADLPDGSLAEKRREAIGTPPEPVVQGGAEDAKKNK